MRTVPALLQAHLDTGTTTTTMLMRIVPTAPGYASLGITLLDRDVTYDNGSGALVYLASIGMVPANFASSSDMDVDNSEIQHLIPEFDLPISEKDIVAGAYDFAAWELMLVNYEDLTMGHALLGTGQLGQMRVENGLSFWSELTALSKQLKQSIVEKDSITCRAIYGSQPLGTVGAEVTQRFPCGKDTSAEWVSATVTAVGLESSRTCTASGLTQPAAFFQPGMAKWVTGANAGRSYEVETFSGGVMDFTFETMFPIQVGDTFKIRPDCTKWKDGPNGCKAHWGPDWVLHYRGEPDIPIQDANAINTPGVAIGKGAP